eukprot:SAG31_NODE_29412_length_395_cov_2.337838_1_plen_63_part_10
MFGLPEAAKLVLPHIDGCYLYEHLDEQIYDLPVSNHNDRESLLIPANLASRPDQSWQGRVQTT